MIPPLIWALFAGVVGLLAVLGSISVALRRRTARLEATVADLAGRVRDLEAAGFARFVAASTRPEPDPTPPRHPLARQADRPAPTLPTPAGPTLIAVPNLAVGTSGPAPSSAPGAAADLGRRFGDVWALADSGASAQSIAGRTGHPVGQVELILGLRRQAAPAEVPVPPADRRP